MANGTVALLVQYWPTLTVKESPPLGPETSNKAANGFTLPNGLCTLRAGCARPQFQSETLGPCMATILSKAVSRALFIKVLHPALPHQVGSSLASTPSTAGRKARLPNNALKRASPNFGKTMARVTSSIQTA